MSQSEELVEEPKDFDFNQILPSMHRIFTWLLMITVGGMMVFPFFAITVDSKYAHHFWILWVLDIGLMLALLNFRGHISSFDDTNQDEKNKQVKQEAKQNAGKKQKQKNKRA